MATINIGSIKFKWKGTYNALTAYTVDDVVEYNGSSYICILASTGNLPTNATYFEQMSQAGTNGTDGTDLTTTLTTQGDILYRDGSGLQRLGAGTSGQVLQSGGTGANVSWTDQAGGATEVLTYTTLSSSGTSSSIIETTDWSTNGFYKISIVGQMQTSAGAGSDSARNLNFRFRNSSGDISDNNQWKVGFNMYANESHSDVQFGANRDLNGTSLLQINGWGQHASRNMGMFQADIFAPDVNNRQTMFHEYYNNSNDADPYHAHYRNVFSTNDSNTKTGWKIFNSSGYNLTDGFYVAIGHKKS